MTSGRHLEHIDKARQAIKMGATLTQQTTLRPPKGSLIVEMRDSKTGEVLENWAKDNVITKDGGVLAALLFQSRGGPARGLSMLTVGTGARGSLLNPDAPDARQRALEAEIGRKVFASVVYRDSDGGASAIPTNVVDFTTTFGEAEAVGPLNEMGLVSPLSDNPNVKTPVEAVFPEYDGTVDVSAHDILINYLTFPVMSKPSTAILTITWRLTF
jgi:hypothetical protein